MRDPQISNDLNVLASKHNFTISSIGFGNDTDYVQKANENKTGNTATNSSTTASTSGQTNTQKLKLVSVNLMLTGEGNQLVKFIKSIEEDTRIAEVDNVSIAAKSETKNTVQASMTINYYYNYNPDSKDKPKYDELTRGSSGKDNLFN